MRWVPPFAIALPVAAASAGAEPTREPDGFSARLVAAALERTRHAVRNDGRYRRIAYPGGDVPAEVNLATLFRLHGVVLPVTDRSHRPQAARSEPQANEAQ